MRFQELNNNLLNEIYATLLCIDFYKGLLAKPWCSTLVLCSKFILALRNVKFNKKNKVNNIRNVSDIFKTYTYL